MASCRCKSDEVRNIKQRERQQKLRETGRKAKRPDRDDVARTALFMAISSMGSKQATRALDAYKSLVVELLVRQGFDEEESVEVLDDLAAKYWKGDWPFRRKIHLLYPNGPEED